MQKLLVGSSKIIKELVLVLSIQLYPLPEALVLDQGLHDKQRMCYSPCLIKKEMQSLCNSKGAYNALKTILLQGTMRPQASILGCLGR